LPKVPEAAWHGTIGKAVVAIAPYTEADPAAILAQALAFFGALVGDSPHVRVGGIVHRARVWPLLVGRTSRGRKGTSLHEARWLTRRYSTHAENYLQNRVLQGLSTGEGLLAALGAGKSSDNPDDQAAAADGKLTIEESEFARILNVAKREGNNLGQVLRQLWENDSAGSMTRQAPLRVDNAHLTLICHVTPGELRVKLHDADVLGGTLNRFLFVACERTQLISRELLRPDLSDLTRLLGEAAEAGRWIREVRRDRRAEDLWDEVYGALCADEPDGQLGAVLGRGPAYTNRLAMLYALADGASAIATDHLLAGLGMWHYAAESARQLFDDGRRRGDEERLAEFVAGAQGGRTRTEIYVDLFNRNKSKGEIDGMVDRLIAHGDLAEDRQVDTGGRPVTWLLWVGAPRDAVAEVLERYRYGYQTP